jgi:hypothetical protein
MKAESALVQARVREVFRRLPLLLGFSLDTDLSLADVEVHGCPNCEWSERVYGEIDDEISALVAELESDAASELLRGRTFARVLQ